MSELRGVWLYYVMVTDESTGGSVVLSVRIDRGALAVLEWYARVRGVALRSWLRGELEGEALRVSELLDVGEAPGDLALGTFVPVVPEGWR